ncbi:MAG: CPBP family intramembrane metalloprotease [Planctomycetes bacterium]|nr:CPBP family intramembrane metalloprotease [Planctomycetota bacterium]
MTVIDHLFVFVLLVIVPLYQHFYAVPKMHREFAEESPGLRERTYWYTIATQWGITIALLFLWWLAARGLDALGLVIPGGWLFWISIVIVMVAIAVFWMVLQAQASTPESHAKVLKAFQERAPFMPRNSGEMRHFTAISVTAGICEEIVYRGYLIWYATQFTGAGTGGLLMAVALTSLVFGLGHIYQGVSGAIQIFAAGLFFGCIYVLSGSLWVPMAAHAIIDIVAGLYTVHLHRDQPARSDEKSDDTTACITPDEQSASCSV